MARVCQLFSGSEGNSTFIGNDNGGILVDIGVSAKRITERLESIGVSPCDIEAIFITHEHIDHVKGLRVFAKKYNTKVFATEATLDELDRAGHLNGDFDVYAMDSSVELEKAKVTNFHTSHDSADSCGYTVTLRDDRKISVCTDLGYVSQTVRDNLYGSDLIVFESNHDVNMLKSNINYPETLKRRILGVGGHLSNYDSCVELPKFVQNGTSRIILAHLSSENNTPQIALKSAVTALESCGAQKGRDYLITTAGIQGTDLVIF